MAGITLEQPPLDNPTKPLQQWFHKLWLVVTGGGIVPSGSVMAFAGTSAPTGYLNCDGSAVSRTTYSDLFAAIGITHGQGDNSTTFNLPDYRGRFLRGIDNGAGNDPDTSSRTMMATGGNTGDNIGSVQGHAFQTHNHATTENAHSHGAPSGFTNFLYGGSNGSGGGTGTVGFSSLTGTAKTNLTINNAAASGGKSQSTANETRPVNAYVNFIIKT